MTRWPRAAAVQAKASPAGPAPTTAIRLGAGAGSSRSSVSWQARGLTRQEQISPEKIASRQAWLQAMQVLISAARPSSALRTSSASARNGRAIETRSASPRASTASATAGSLIRLVATSGIRMAPRSRRVTQVKAARGTIVAMVGIRASCQPMPVFTMLAPAASTAWARATTSSQLEPSSTRSSIESRYTRIASGPRAARTRRTTSTGNRSRFSSEPPQRLVRRFVRGATNSFRRYPSDPITSTPSYPASRARAAQRAKSSMVASTSAPESSRGFTGEMGARIAEGATAPGWAAYRPVWRICRQMSPPAACTAAVTGRCARASAASVSFAAPGQTTPSAFGATPPVTMSPAPPRARSA